MLRAPSLIPPRHETCQQPFRWPPGARWVRLMNDVATQPVLRFTSHIAGKNARVSVYRDRIEWSRKGWVGATARHTAGALTAGASYLFTGVKTKDDGEMLPIKAISSITSKRGMLNTLLTFVTTGNTLEMNVSHKEAAAVKDLVQTLMLNPDAPVVTIDLPSAGDAPEPQSPSPQTQPEQPDLAAELQKFAALRDQGIITNDDFEAKKRQLLGL